MARVFIGKYYAWFAWQNDDGSASGTGRAELDFGSAPGSESTTKVITGLTTLALASKAEAWLDTEDATSDGKTAAQVRDAVGYIRLSVGNFSGGIGLTIFADGFPLDDEAANTVYAGPISGSDAAPDFRALVVADIPNLSASYDVAGAAAAAQAASQPLDADLTALAGLAATAGMLARTGAGAFAVRTLAATSPLSMANGDGVNAAPTVSLPSISFAQWVEFNAGVSQNGVASLGFSLPASNPAVASAAVGSNAIVGVAQFTATGQNAQCSFTLPDDWVSGSGNDIEFNFRSVGITGNVVWSAQTAFTAPTGVIIDPSFNSAQTVSIAARGTTLHTNRATISTFTTTGAAAGYRMWLKLSLDASTTTVGNQDLISVRIKLKRTVTFA